MDISRRVKGLSASATLAVGARASALRAAGVNVLSFAAGEPDFDTPAPIKRAAIRALEDGLTGYGPVPGDGESRSLLALKFQRENGIPNVTPDHIVVSSGGKHSLYLLFQTLIDPPSGDDPAQQVILPTPAWVSYAPQARLAGAEVVEVPTDARSAFKMTPEQLRAAITPRSRVLVLNSPSNPCGTMYSPAELRELAGVVGEAAASTAPDLLVISDELYEKIIFGDHEHFSIGSVPEVAERTITVNGLSKAYAMTGWRIGYFASSGEFGLAVAGGVKKLQSQSTTSIPTFLMPAIRAALTECEEDVQRMCAAFAERAVLTHELVSSIEGFVCPRPTGAFYVFPDVSAHFGKSTPSGRPIDSAMSFAAALLEEAHVACVPGEDFGAGGERCCRFTFACAESQIREGFDRVREFVESLR